MKTPFPSRPDRLPQQRGFALIVTLSLMILLTIIAVGLLTLSSISLRSSAQGSAMATAQANARLALMLALGDLQKNAGPDQRVTARADILDTDPSRKSKNPRLTGVWKSWELPAGTLPSTAEYDQAARDNKFLGWMTSSLDNKASLIGFAKDTTMVTTGNPAPAVTLWDKGSLGKTALASDIVIASKIPTSPSRGALAWAVMDEGVKVRINTPYVDQATSKGMQSAQLGSGERPNTASITGLQGLDRPIFEHGKPGFGTIEKGITRQSLELAATSLADQSAADALKPLTHDVTSSSVGIFTNTASGGLKEDLSLITSNPALPTPYKGANVAGRFQGKGIYNSLLGVSAPSDPTWESLWQFARLYKDSTRLVSSGGVPVLKAQGPAGWTAAVGSNPSSAIPGVIQPAPPGGMVLMPTIAGVQVVFSLLTRDIYTYPRPPGTDPIPDLTPKPPGTKAQEETTELHNPWGKRLAGSSYDYLLHLLYTPVVTLHNPYNVALEFTELRVIFGNIPFALQVFRNGVAQTNGPAPLDTMYYQESEAGNRAKRFGMNLRTTAGSVSNPVPGNINTPFRLLPGEVVLFSPYIDPNRTWRDEYSDRRFSDWDTGSTNGGGTRTLSIDGMPGWRGEGIGFDLDWFCPSYKGLRVTTQEKENGVVMDRGGCIPARANDEFSVQFAPLSVDALSKNRFTVEIFAKPLATSSHVSSGIIELDYEKPTGLQESLLGPNGKITYPKTGTVNAMSMHVHSLTRIKDTITPKAFALISARAKTTNGGKIIDGADGKLATKPWTFGHASVATANQKLSEHPANHSHEFSIELLNGNTTNLFQTNVNNGRGRFITGLTTSEGVSFGVQNDIPLTPIQTLAGLNGANLGGSSGFLPRFAQPVGNSWAHPLISSDKIVQPGPSGYSYVDHSYLLNLALYDRFYFSGLADQTGPFGVAGRTTSTLVSEFISGLPLVDPRLTLRTPHGKANSQLSAEVADPDAYAKIASWQLMNGAFNINSTSVAAWKAMLGSIHDSQAVANRLNKVSKNSAFSNLAATGSGKSRISRFRLPVESDDPIENYWLGAREYDDGELEDLAEKIVEQVKLRGPFLTMSEFVNRRIGNDPTAQRGALQQAIDNTNLNQNLGMNLRAGYEIPTAAVAGYNYANPAAGTGSSFQGAPGYLSQADLLNVLGNAATPRSDTFTIRGYGEARDATNKILASATCEAIIQRIPEYIDPADKPEAIPTALSSLANKTFGRRFNIISFRWLSASEI